VIADVLFVMSLLMMNVDLWDVVEVIYDVLDVYVDEMLLRRVMMLMTFMTVVDVLVVDVGESHGIALFKTAFVAKLFKTALMAKVV